MEFKTISDVYKRQGLTVEEVTELRKKMREAGVEYKVYKNTLVRKAAKEVGIEQFNDELLVGTNAIAFGYEDPVAPARILKEFMDSHPKMQLKMGVVEGEFYNESQIVEFANIPSREVLLAKLLGSLKAPMSNFAYLIAVSYTHLDVYKRQELAIEMLRQLKQVAPILFRNMGPNCVQGPCPEGNMTCGKIVEIREKFKNL